MPERLRPLVAIALLTAGLALSACSAGTPPDAQVGTGENSYEAFDDSAAMAKTAQVVVRTRDPEPTGDFLTVPGHQITIAPDGTETADDVDAPVYEVIVDDIVSGEEGVVKTGDRLRVAAAVDTDSAPPASQDALLAQGGTLTLYLTRSADDSVWSTLSPFQGIEAS